MTTLVWFRNDLRVADHPALYESSREGPVVAVFLCATAQWRSHDVGANRLAFLLDSLHVLARQLADLGIPLHVESAPDFADAPGALIRLARKLDISTIAFNEEYPLNERVRDSHVHNACREAGIRVRVHPGSTIMAPGTLFTGSGEPYTVFTPFKRRWLATVAPAAIAPLPAPAPQPRPDSEPAALPDHIDQIGRDHRILAHWPGGAIEAERRLQRFVDGPIRDYARMRDFPAVAGTSTLSPYLSLGAISPRQSLSAALAVDGGRFDGDPGVAAWINELIWRDFYRHVIALFPHVSRGQAFRPEMDRVPWRHAPDEFRAWQEGRTGYPLVDAAMRQLASTGWMHNRLRMLTAMFLTKHLLIDWRLGERHFMEQLVDGDFAANNGGWQWSASTGTDAAPYFRIFNPFTQARRFDPDGQFVRMHVSELADAPATAIFEPHRAPIRGYPTPIVDHGEARTRALETFKAARHALPDETGS